MSVSGRKSVDCFFLLPFNSMYLIRSVCVCVCKGRIGCFLLPLDVNLAYCPFLKTAAL